jgi:NAD(P)-dependent dehydrogenase (short-subunit alcohol dehydrogenase family)
MRHSQKRYYHSSADELSHNLSANLYGVINTVNAFLPLLRKGEKKQIFVTSSIVGSIGGPLGGMAGAGACKSVSLSLSLSSKYRISV